MVLGDDHLRKSSIDIRGIRKPCQTKSHHRPMYQAYQFQKQDSADIFPIEINLVSEPIQNQLVNLCDRAKSCPHKPYSNSSHDGICVG